MSTQATAWMSWEGGVDLVALSQEGLEQPNVIVHVARMVHTPVGSAPSGMVLLPGPDGQPVFAGFVSGSKDVGAYFGPNIFAGTPFENVPVVQTDIEVVIESRGRASVKLSVPGHDIELVLTDLGELNAVDRPAGGLPFSERAIEAKAGHASLKVNGQELPVIVPPAGMSGGPAAVYSACGMYWR